MAGDEAIKVTRYVARDTVCCVSRAEPLIMCRRRSRCCGRSEGLVKVAVMMSALEARMVAKTTQE